MPTCTVPVVRRASSASHPASIAAEPTRRRPWQPISTASSHEGRDALIADVRRRIDAEGITYIYYQFVSVTGRIMGKGVPAAHWESMAAKGFQLVYGATANLFTDRHGDYIGYGPEAAELVGIPEPETFEVAALGPQGRARLVHAASATARSARIPASFLTSDCRGNLKRIQAEFEAATGLHLRAGTEPEMMWLNLKDRTARPTSAASRSRTATTSTSSRELQPIIHKVIEYGQALGLDMIQGDHEDAPGQIELNFNFDRAEQTADNLSTFRQICKPGRPRAERLPVLHAEAVHGRLGQRLPPQHLALARRRERVHAGDGRPAAAEPDRPLGDRRHPRAPRRADGDHRRRR